jgi:phage gp36-like protein
MTTYATRTDLNRFFSSVNITEWADRDRDGTLNEEELLAVDATLDAAQAEIDNRLAQAGYDAPFEGESYAQLSVKIKSLLRQWTAVVAGYYLYAWRSVGEKVNPFQELYQKTEQQLKSLMTGTPLAGLSRSSRVRFRTGSDRCRPTDELANVETDGWNW